MDMETVYKRCWEHYKLSRDYSLCVQTMEEKGMKLPYIDNILRTAFDFAWNSKKEIYKKEKPKSV